jgi:hypothetical protein
LKTRTSGDDASDISPINAGIRAGRRITFGGGHLFATCIGIDHLGINTRVQGIATLQNAFANGDGLHVRYDVQLDNTDKYSGIPGFNPGFRNGTAIRFEWNNSKQRERFVLSGEARF